ncbi:MAG: hypothetical protein MJ174_01845 [Treponema sp.]|nr:hypothetical protein [Treponema sp.]
MKKLLVAVLFMVCSSGLFANIFLQQNLTAPVLGNDNHFEWDFKFNSFNCYNNTFGTITDDISLSLFYEFNSDKQLKVHPFVGGEIGFYYYGLGVLAGGGANINLTSFGNTDLELSCYGELGYFGDIFGGSHFIGKSSCLLQFVPKSRQGFFGGFGVSNKVVADADIYWGQEINMNTYCSLGLAFSAGYRF